MDTPTDDHSSLLADVDDIVSDGQQRQLQTAKCARKGRHCLVEFCVRPNSPLQERVLVRDR